MYFQDIGSTRSIFLETEEEIEAYAEDNFRLLVKTAARRLWASLIYDDVNGYPLESFAYEDWTDSDVYQEYEQYIESEKGAKYLDRYVGMCFQSGLYCLYLNGEK